MGANHFWMGLLIFLFYDIFMKYFYKYNIYVDLELSQAMYKNKNSCSEIVLSHCGENLNKPTCPIVVKPLPTRGHQISSCALKCYNWQRTQRIEKLSVGKKIYIYIFLIQLLDRHKNHRFSFHFFVNLCIHWYIKRQVSKNLFSLWIGR